MPNVDEVRPRIWANVIDLYDDDDYGNDDDDGHFSAIWGCREQDSTRSLGVRWNGAGRVNWNNGKSNGYVGYPNQANNPVWFSEPCFLQHSILATLLERVKTKSKHPRKEEFIKNILIALKECESDN